MAYLSFQELIQRIDFLPTRLALLRLVTIGPSLANFKVLEKSADYLHTCTNMPLIT